MLSKLFKSLESGIRDLAHFVGVEVLPFLAIELVVEAHDKIHTFHVDEGISDIALVLEIDWKVKEVVDVRMG